MLKTFRENFKHLKWVLWGVIAVFVLFVFVDWGMGSASGGRTGGDIAATVGSHKISLGEFQREYRETEDRYRQMYGKSWTPDLAKAMNLPTQVLNGLIDRRLFKDEANRLGLTVTDAEVRARLLRMPDGQGRPLFVRDGAFIGDAAYKRMLASVGLTPHEFEAQTRDQVLLEKLNRFYTEAVFVSDAELEEEFAARSVKAKASYVLVGTPQGAAPSVTDAEAEAWFKQNGASYRQGEKRRPAWLLVDREKLRQSAVVTDADVASEYNGNIDSYRRKAEVKARHILYKSDGTPAQDAAARAKSDAAMARLKKGADFAALAKAESEDPGSKESGGDLGSFGPGRMVKEFEDPVFAAAPGTLVGPVKTPFGYHVILVEAKTPERVQPLFEVSTAIRARLAEQRASDEGKRLAQELADRLARKGGLSAADLKKLAVGNVTFAEADFVSRGDAIPPFGPAPALSEAIFSLKEGLVSEPVSTPRGEAIVVVTAIRPPGDPTFAEVKARVVADLAAKKQEDAALAALKQAMVPGASLADVAGKLGVKVETPESFGKSGPVGSLGAPKAFLDAVFAAPVGELKGPVVVPGRGALAFQLLEKSVFDKAAFEAQKEQERDKMKNQRSGRLLQSLVGRRRAESKIDINREVLSRFGGRA